MGITTMYSFLKIYKVEMKFDVRCKFTVLLVISTDATGHYVFMVQG